MISGKLIANQNGFTILEALIGGAMATVVSLGIAAYISVAKQREEASRDMQEFNDLVQQVSMAFDDPKICSDNLEGKIIPSGRAGQQQPLKMDQAMVHDVQFATSERKSILTKDQEFKTDANGNTVLGGLKATGVEIYLKQSLGNNRHIASLTVRAVKNKDKSGTGSNDFHMAQSLSIFVGTDAANRVQFCYGVGGNGGPPDLLQSVCKISSDGNLFYNIKTKECAARFEKRFFTQGNRNLASCPDTTEGMFSKNIKEVCLSTATEYAPLNITRTYLDSRIIPAVPPKPYVCEMATENSVSCIYASDATTQNAVCSVGCKIDKLPDYIRNGEAASDQDIGAI